MAAPLILDVTRFHEIFRGLFADRVDPVHKWSDITINGELSVFLYDGLENVFRLLCIQPPNNRAPHVEFTVSRQDGRLIGQIVCTVHEDCWTVTLGDTTTPGVALLKGRVLENVPITFEAACRFIPLMARLVI